MTEGGVSVRQLGGALSIPELVRLILAGSSADWRSGATQANELAQDHAAISDRARQALTRLESSWTGGGADAARARISPAVEATYQASSAYENNARTLNDASYAFDRLKSEVEPMPDQPPTRGIWDAITPWDTDTEVEINRYRELEERNRRAYEAYEQHTLTTLQQVTYDYGKLHEFGTGEVTLNKNEEETGRARSSDQEVRTSEEKGDKGGTRRDDGGSDDSRGQKKDEKSDQKNDQKNDDDRGQKKDEKKDQKNEEKNRIEGSGPDPDNLRPAVHYLGPEDSSIVRTHSGGDGFTGGNRTGLDSEFTGGRGTDSTSVSGYRPPSETSSTYRPAAYQPSTFPPLSQSTSSGSGSPGSWAVTGGSPITGGYSGSSVGGGSGSGVSGGRPGAGVGGAVGSPPGPGRGSGAAPFGTSATPGQGAVRPGAAGAVGRGGVAPMGAMGAPGGRGQGAEDSEHQRNYIEDTDEAFSFGEDDEEWRDPETGHIVTPPTIGE